MSKVPQPCDYYCFDDFLSGKTDDLCSECQAYYEYWCEVDDSEMDIDWSEYEELYENGEWRGLHPDT